MNRERDKIRTTIPNLGSRIREIIPTIALARVLGPKILEPGENLVSINL